MTISKLYRKALILIAFLLLSSPAVLYAQDKPLSKRNKKLEKANEKFKTFRYIDAREIYEELLQDYPSGNREIFSKLADTYYFNSQYTQASDLYKKLIDDFAPTVNDTIYYFRAAQSLRSIGDEASANKLMDDLESIIGSQAFSAEFGKTRERGENKEYDIEKASINSDASDFGPSFYQDKVVFASASNTRPDGKIHDWTGQPFLNLFIADRDSEGRLSNRDTLDGKLNTIFNESSTAFTRDGKTVYFTRNNYTDGKKGRDSKKTIRLKLYKSTKSGENFWTEAVELPSPINSDNYSTAHPALSVDETKLYFSSDRPTVEGEEELSDIWVVDILPETDTGFGRPKKLKGINTVARESFPYISQANILYFSSDSPGGNGGLDVYSTQLDDSGNPTTIISLGDAVNSEKDDFGFIFNEEEGIGYFSSNKDGEGGSASDDIYRVFYKPCDITLTGVVTDGYTNELLAGAKVDLLSQATMEVLTSVIVGDDARYTFPNVAVCASSYIIRGSYEEQQYYPYEKIFTTPNETKVIDIPIPLNKCLEGDLSCLLCLQPIFFEFDRWTITEKAEIELRQVAIALNEPKWNIKQIEIGSHTDSRGSDEYNEALAQKRADATVAWLIDENKGNVDPSKLVAKGYGEYQLLNRCQFFDPANCGALSRVSGCTDEKLNDSTYKCSDGVKCAETEHDRNRRSTFRVIYQDQSQ